MSFIAAPGRHTRPNFLPNPMQAMVMGAISGIVSSCDKRPTQTLALIVVSAERQTGKSTLVQFMCCDKEWVDATLILADEWALISSKDVFANLKASIASLPQRNPFAIIVDLGNVSRDQQSEVIGIAKQMTTGRVEFDNEFIEFLAPPTILILTNGEHEDLNHDPSVTFMHFPYCFCPFS